MKAVGTVRCAECQKVVAGYVPRGGDGSALHTFRHSASTDEGNDATCRGSYRLGAENGRDVSGSAVRP